MKLKSFLIVLMFIFSICIPVFLYIEPVKAFGENWLSGWTYRKEITVSNKLDGYQTMVSLFNETGHTYNCSGHIGLSNFSDIRFTRSDGNTLIPHWIENYTTDTQCNVWVNNSYNETTLYLYYGNSSASDISDGNNTFIAFDDFESYDLDENVNGQNNWTTIQGDSGAFVLVKANPSGTGQVMEIYESATTSTHPSLAYGLSNKLPDFRLGFDVYFIGTKDVYIPYFFEDGTACFNARGFYSLGTSWRWYDGGSYNDFSPSYASMTNNVWFNTSWNVISTGTNDFDMFIDHDSGHDGGSRSDPSVGINNIYFQRQDDNGYCIDNVFVALFTTGTEPSFSFDTESTESSLSSSVDYISPYEQTISPLQINATADSSPDKVSLWYRWSDDNSSWDGGTGGFGNETVDNSCDEYSPTGVGSHDVFNDMLSKDGSMDTLTEGDNGTSNNFVNDSVDSNSCNVDSSDPADIGNETSFENCQDINPDSDYMNIQENDTSVEGTDEWLYVGNENGGYDGTYQNWDSRTGSSPYLDAVDGTSYIYEDKTTGMTEGWFYFDNTTATGTGFTVNMSFYMKDEINNDGFTLYYDTTGGGSGTQLGTNFIANSVTYTWVTVELPGTYSADQINDMRVYLLTYMDGKGTPVWVDAGRMGVYKAGSSTNYELDFEYQWTSADNDETNEYVCIEVNDHTGNDNLNVSYWAGSSWTHLGFITGTGWSNFTATGLTSATYTIRINTTADSSDTTQDNWNIDVIKLYCYSTGITNYGLDLEVNWTDISYNHDVEQLCIYTGTQDSEALEVDVYSGGSWVNLIADLSASSWNNVSITSYLTGSTFIIRFKGDVETGDSSQGSWEIDFAKIYYYNTSGGTHGCNWMEWDNTSNPDGETPFSWDFDFPNSTGYYEFYSIANKSGYPNESAPGTKDAMCHYTLSLGLYLSGNDCSPNNGVDSYTVFYFNVTWTDSDGDTPDDPSAYLKVNISRDGWNGNYSMNWVSGDNTTGALYSYSLILTTGSYSYNIWAYDGDTEYDDVSGSEPSVEALSQALTIQTASSGDYLRFNDWAISNPGFGLTIEYNVSEDNQTSVTPALNITNTGNVPLNITLNLSGNPGSGITIKYNLSDNAPNPSENSIAVSPSITEIYSNLGVSSILSVWIWMDFVSVEAQSSSITLRVNSTVYNN